MNTENQTPAPPEPQHPVSPDSQTPPSAVPPSLISDEPSADLNRQETPLSTWRHNGKVARLPKDLRDKINIMLQDGVTYPAILQSLGEPGKGLNVMNLSRWKDTGYKDWLLEQTWLDHTRARQETGAALSTDFDATQLNHAALQLATLQIFETLRDLGPGSLSPSEASREEPPATCGPATTDPQPSTVDAAVQALDAVSSSPTTQTPTSESEAARPRNGEQAKKRRSRSGLDFRLGGDSAGFVRRINALARASRETMLLQKYRDACTQARAALAPRKDFNREFNEAETQAIVRKLDEVLGFR
jgi:hypothetical protein